MKIIVLTRDQVTFIDDEDYEWLSQWEWHALWRPVARTYYANGAIHSPEGKWIGLYMHRLILGLEHGDKRQGDHINHVTLDNRRSNLRVVSPSENQWNQDAIKKGYYRTRTGKYGAQIKVFGDHKYLGLFETTEEAHQAYLNAKKIYHQISN